MYDNPQASDMGIPKGEFQVQAIDEGFLVKITTYPMAPDGRGFLRRERNMARATTSDVRDDFNSWVNEHSNLALPEDTGNLTKFPTS